MSITRREQACSVYSIEMIARRCCVRHAFRALRRSVAGVELGWSHVIRDIITSQRRTMERVS